MTKVIAFFLQNIIRIHSLKAAPVIESFDHEAVAQVTAFLFVRIVSGTLPVVGTWCRGWHPEWNNTFVGR
jgi:hypothetical protein